jgi:DNA-binding MarR family transcriptional regulator
MKENYTLLLERLSSIRKLRGKILAEVNSKLGDISKTEYVLMHKICNGVERLKMSDLSDSTGYSNAIITLSVDGLESKGFVKRRRGEDRRSYFVTLTRKGEEKCREIRRLEKESIEAIFANMKAEDLSELQEILKRLDDLIVKYV